MSASFASLPPARRGYWVASDVAALLGCCRTTARNLIDSGEIPSRHSGLTRKRMVGHDQLLAWLASRPRFVGLIPRAEEIGRYGAKEAPCVTGLPYPDPGAVEAVARMNGHAQPASVGIASAEPSGVTRGGTQGVERDGAGGRP